MMLHLQIFPQRNIKKNFRTFQQPSIQSQKNVTLSLCISLLQTESRQRPEHINRKTATFGTFLRIILNKNILKLGRLRKVSFCIKSSSYLEKKYLQLQFYCINVPIFKETSPLLTKCTVQCGVRISKNIFHLTLPYCRHQLPTLAFCAKKSARSKQPSPRKSCTCIQRAQCARTPFLADSSSAKFCLVLGSSVGVESRLHNHQKVVKTSCTP